MPARYVVKLYIGYVNNGRLSTTVQCKVEDMKENRTICYCSFVADANNIAKAMNVSDSWDPILMTSEEVK